jgi:hypothetical protein
VDTKLIELVVGMEFKLGVVDFCLESMELLKE